jgi:uncharacterized protein (DUF2336 family)
MTFKLQYADVQRLMSQPSPTARLEVAGKLARTIDDLNLKPSELEMAQNIVRMLAQDVQIMVRQVLAQHLRRSKHLPHDVALHLANDVEAVALPILLDSDILTDDDLLMLIRDGSIVKQKAIASRADVPETLSTEIITTTSEIVVVTLMNNKGAHITDKSYLRAIDRFSASDAIKESMVKRAKLPVNVAERLITLVSAQLKTYLIQHHEISPATAKELVQQSQERAALKVGKVKSIEEIETLVRQMYVGGRLTPSLVMRALCMGNLLFFEFGMSALSGVLIIPARTLIHDPGQAGLASLWETASMPPKLLPLAQIVLDVMHEIKLGNEPEDLQRFRSRITERMLTQMGNSDTQNMEYMMDLLQ